MRFKGIKTPKKNLVRDLQWLKDNANRIWRDYAIKNRISLNKKCQVCHKPRAIAHHPDYYKPLQIIWVCRSCHFKVHANLISLDNYATTCKGV